MPASTQYTVANDLTDRVVYYHTMFNRRVRMIDLKKIGFAKPGLRAVPLDKTRAEDIKDVTVELE